jgi:membrane peptidoglycan carboxypeptidase
VNGTGINGAGANGARANGGGANGAGGNGTRIGSGRPGRGQRAAAYPRDAYGNTMQRSGPEAPDEIGWRGRGDDSRSPGGGRRSGRGGGRGSGGPGGPGGPDGPDGGRRSFKQWLLYGSWWRRWTWKKALAVGLAIPLGVIVLALVTFFVAYAKTTIPTDTSAIATAEPSQVYFANGHTLGTFSDGGVNRQILQTSQIPKVMDDAMIAAEDRQFYTEGGISPAGMVRAAITDLKGGSYSAGGSTITVQLVKNYYTGFEVNNSDKQAGNKLKEILVAIKLAHTKSKSWILTQYLNIVPFGHGAYGVGAAAHIYFGKPAMKLTVSQAAMLAAMPNEPSYFDPDPSAGAAYTALKARWSYVLTNMVRDGAVTQAKVDKMKFPKVHYHLGSSLNGYRGYLMQMVDQELTSTYGLTQSQLDTGGFKITTTFSQVMMNGLYKAVATDKQMMAADGVPLPVYAHVGAVLEQPSTGAIKAVYGGPGYGVKNCAKVFCQLNMAEDPKQVGSSFKPYVLAAAVSQGMNVQTSVLNGYSPLWIPQGQSLTDRQVLSIRRKPTAEESNVQNYWPFNEPSENSGPLTVSKAAAISSDPAFEDLAHRAGVPNVIDMAKNFGVGQTPFDQGSANDFTALNDMFGNKSKADSAGSVTIALGVADLTAVEQASTFATLANGGMYHAPHVVAKLVHGGGVLPSRVQSHQVLQADEAADVDYALSFDNVPGGTAYPQAAWSGRQVIGKTGTTETAQDAWFLGAIPQYSMAVTLFTNHQDSSLSPGAQTLDILPRLPNQATGGYGGAWPAEIWHTFMSTMMTDLAPAPLPTPDFTNFIEWNQVGSQPPPVQPTPDPTSSAPPPPPPTTCPPGQQPGGQGCVPVSPPPTTTSPPVAPTPTCTPQLGQQCPPQGPGQNNRTTAAIIQPAGEAASTRLLRSRAGLTVLTT